MFTFFHQKENTYDEKNDVDKTDEIIDVEKINDSEKIMSMTSDLIPQEAIQDDDMVKDLAVLIGNAISIWTKKYGLDNLPRDIALDQAISIMVAVRDSMK